MGMKMNLFDKLSRPFPLNAIHWRIGSTNVKKIRRETGDNNARPTKGIPLAYIDARDVYNRLDEAVGPFNWQDKYPFEGCCEISIKDPDTGEWICKSNGAGRTDIEGEKGQYSDAFKRAAVLWGVGQYLYDLPNEWVDLDDWGRFKAPPKLPTWATSSGWIRLPLSERQGVRTMTIDALANSDKCGLDQVWDEYSHEQHLQLWTMFNSIEREAIKDLRKT